VFECPLPLEAHSGLALAANVGNPPGVPPSGGPVSKLMHGRPLVYRHHAFGRRRTVAQGAVRSDCVEVVPPAFDQDLGFSQRVEDLAVEQLISEAGIEALTIAVFPR